jgi:hypothetical protein
LHNSSNKTNVLSIHPLIHHNFPLSPQFSGGPSFSIHVDVDECVKIGGLLNADEGKRGEGSISNYVCTFHLSLDGRYQNVADLFGSNHGILHLQLSISTSRGCIDKNLRKNNS